WGLGEQSLLNLAREAELPGAGVHHPFRLPALDELGDLAAKVGQQREQLPVRQAEVRAKELQNAEGVPVAPQGEGQGAAWPIPLGRHGAGERRLRNPGELPRAPGPAGQAFAASEGDLPAELLKRGDLDAGDVPDLGAAADA